MKVYLYMQTTTTETSVRIKKVTLQKLKDLKIHPRQSYDEMIDLVATSYALQQKSIPKNLKVYEEKEVKKK